MIIEKIFSTGKTVYIKLDDRYIMNVDFESFFIGNLLQTKEEIIKIIRQYPINRYHEFILGHWCFFKISDEFLLVATDILAGQRIYYSIINDTLIISDDYQFNLIKLKCKAGLKINQAHKQYWKKHRFTLGSKTFIENLLKFQPCSTYSFDAYLGCHEKIVFSDLENNSDYRKHNMSIFYSMISYFENLAKLPSTKFILMFSGGYDSILLALFLKYLKIDFTCVYFPKEYKINERDKVLLLGKKLDLAIDIMEFDPSYNLEAIIENQTFDRHDSILIYKGINAVVNKYGKNICLINGQGSDSILTFGPSENSIQSFMRRWVIYKRGIAANFFKLILSKYFNKKFSFPKSKNEKIQSFLDEYHYCFLLDNSFSDDYRSFLNKYSTKIDNNYNFLESALMYAKIFSFLQGSDNQVLVNACKEYNVRYLSLPFTNPNIIYNTILYKNSNRDIFKPKYVVKDILKKVFHFRMPFKFILSDLVTIGAKSSEQINVECLILNYVDVELVK